ncbi:MAG: hypothetical protein AAFN07_10485 [Pseudomonadota bacterium]
MRLNNGLMLLSLMVATVGFWNRNALPPAASILPLLDVDPVQDRTINRAFAVDWKGREYRIEPKFGYELTGLVVSYRLHDGENSRMHRRSDDHLNAADLCVVWGNNARIPELGEYKFRSGVFTCFWTYRSRAAGQRFNEQQISNNHLLTDDPEIRREISRVRIGDQIRLSGVLAEYMSPNGSRRGTSTTRTDTGDGACETIYLNQFEIIKREISPWRWAWWLGSLMLLITLIVHFRTPHRAR